MLCVANDDYYSAFLDFTYMLVALLAINKIDKALFKVFCDLLGLSYNESFDLNKVLEIIESDAPLKWDIDWNPENSIYDPNEEEEIKENETENIDIFYTQNVLDDELNSISQIYLR